MKLVQKLGLILLALNLGACASIIDGTSQEMTINTNPQGAHCDLERDAKVFATVQKTPETITLKKTKYDITVRCDKTGYQRATHFVKSEIQDATWGNIILGGGVGWAIDSASGADNKYAEYVNITLVPTDGQAASAEDAAPAAPPPVEAPASDASASSAAAAEPMS